MEQPESKLIARIVPGKSTRIETEEYVIHTDPRISATKLGEYLVVDPSKQKTIIKNQKKAKKAVILYYKRTKEAFVKSFGENGIDKDYLLAQAEKIESSNHETEWQKTDNKISAEALVNLAAVADQFDIKKAAKLSKPSSGWGGIDINGVNISIDPAIVFSFEHRGATKVGAVLIYTTRDDSKSLSMALQGNSSGNYVSTLLLKLLESRMGDYGVPLGSKCYVVDVYRKTVYTAPKSFKTLMKHTEDACEVIAGRWSAIQV